MEINIQLFATIILWSFVGIFGIVLLFFIFLFGRHTVKDNPTQAWIFLKTGRHISKPIRGYLKGKPSRKGCRFNYGKNTVFVPASYGDYYHRSKRAIYVNNIGQLIASPFNNDIKLSEKEKNELIYELVESKIGSDGMKALKGTSKMGVMIIVIIAVVICGILFFGYTQYQKRALQEGQSQQQTEQEKPPETEQPIEVK